ncbi:energy transducer TonB [Caenibius sp. WL]|uniref:energy transducer TonB n=1 Tax=Caenibius sp. WL TaxID=2872646 RepID=UPI001C99FBED|nr:energy transducer TonB [Caenibius sp. WL]QZP08289.1 energy transducer TonB [Caenibius sp. WL]
MRWTIFALAVTLSTASQAHTQEESSPTNPAQEAPEHTDAAVVSFSVKVGVDGLPKSCEVIKIIGDPKFASVTCTLIMRRAKFKPEMVNGKPVEGTYGSVVRYRNPPGKTATPASNEGV